VTLVIERSRAVRFFIARLGDYRRSAFQTHQAIKPTSTQGISDRTTSSTDKKTWAEKAVRLVSAFASSVM
jgi:hypothetical protein